MSSIRHVIRIAVVLALICPAAAHADLLSTLIGGGSLTAGGMTFDTWAITLNDADIDPLDPDLIDVTPTVHADGTVELVYTTVGGPGIGTWIVDSFGNGFMDTAIDYEVTSAAPIASVGSDMSMPGAFSTGMMMTEDGEISVETDVTSEGVTIALIEDTVTPDSLLVDTMPLIGGPTMLSVTTNVSLSYDAFPDFEPITLSSFSQAFTPSAVPEPGTFGLAAFACVLVASGYRRRRTA